MDRKNKQTNYHKNIEEDSIDIIEIVKKIWTERILISKVIIASFIVGCFVAVLSPEVYTSQTIFVPQVSGDDMSSNNKLGSQHH